MTGAVTLHPGNVWFRPFLLLIAIGAAAGGPGRAAEQAPGGESAEQARQAYEAKLTEWKEIIKELRALRQEYQEAEPGQTAELQRRWDAAIERGEALIPEVREAAKAAYLAAPNEDLDLTRLLVKLAADAVDRDDFETAYDLGVMLVEHDCGVNEALDIAGVAAFAVNDYERAEKYLKEAESAGSLGELGQSLLPEIDHYKKYWVREQQLRKKEAEADDLPRVRLTTTKGEIVVELFENEAPETVGNFISLVESGFYDGLTFHRVLKNFMAQAGCPIGDGTGGPGYQIYDELDGDAYRRHFRGSLSMANRGPDTGGSQFFITFLPTPHLNGHHTVFGRVIEGMDVLSKLQRRDPDATPPLPEPDKIITAEVIRKRDHEYRPNKVQ